MIMKLLMFIIAVNVAVLMVAFYSYLSQFLKNIFVEPLYAIVSVGIIILSAIVMFMVKKGA